MELLAEFSLAAESADAGSQAAANRIKNRALVVTL